MNQNKYNYILNNLLNYEEYTIQEEDTGVSLYSMLVHEFGYKDRLYMSIGADPDDDIEITEDEMVDFLEEYRLTGWDPDLS